MSKEYIIIERELADDLSKEIDRWSELSSEVMDKEEQVLVPRPQFKLYVKLAHAAMVAADDHKLYGAVYNAEL